MEKNTYCLWTCWFHHILLSLEDPSSSEIDQSGSGQPSNKIDSSDSIALSSLRTQFCLEKINGRIRARIDLREGIPFKIVECGASVIAL